MIKIKRVILKKISIKNFKKIKELTINFKDNTSIYGRNAIGKTTIKDAYLWCLFGKNSENRKDFEVQTLDKDNNVIHNLETRVEITLDINKDIKVFTRVFKEKWVKHKGDLEKNLEGNTTEYYIDYVPQKQKDYNEKVNEILDIDTFKLLSDPMYFCCLPWKEQRSILFEISGSVDDSSVFDYDNSLSKLKNELNGLSIDDYRKKIKFQISKLKKDRDNIPAKIEENYSNIIDIDFEKLEHDKHDIKNKISSVDRNIAECSYSKNKRIEIQNKITELVCKRINKIAEYRAEIQTELLNAEYEYKRKEREFKSNANSPIIELKNKINDVESEINNLISSKKMIEEVIGSKNKLINNNELLLKTAKKEKDDLLVKYHELDEREFVFDDNLSFCPSCGRIYEDIEEIKRVAEEKFNNSKSVKISSIIAQGKAKATEIDKLCEYISILNEDLFNLNEDVNKITTSIKNKEDELKKLENKLENMKENTSNEEFEGAAELKELILHLNDCINNPKVEGLNELNDNINKLELEIKSLKDSDVTDNLIKEKSNLQIKFEEIVKKLANKDKNLEINQRIKELQEEQKALSVEIARLEGLDYDCDRYTKVKCELSESKINSKFKNIKFKLFDNLINGSIVECCVALINGVPYPDVNSAAKINAGIEIINVMSEFHGMKTPIIVDNAEGINTVEETECQLIKLIVSEDDKLRIENN